MSVTVRAAAADDAGALASLRLRAATGSSEDRGPGSGAFVEAFTSWISAHRTSHLPFLAEVDGAVVGMAWLMVAERVPSPDRRHRLHGDVQSVYVTPELRDQGIGAALLDAVLAEARRLELEHVTVHSNDRAVPLYQRASFQHDPRWLRWLPQ